MPNSVEAVITYFSLRHIGAVAVPLSPHEAETRVRHVMEDCTPRFHIGPTGAVSDAVVQSSNSECRRNDVDVQTIIYTSGTTGKPKGVCLSSENWQLNARALIEHHRLDDASIIATSLPLFHCNAHGFAMHASHLAESTLILFNKTPSNLLDILRVERVTVASVVPAILHSLAREQSDWSAPQGFQYFLSAAAPLSADLLRLIISRWKARVIQGYGLTESTNFSCTVPINLDEPTYEQAMFPHPSIGVALPGTELTIEGSSDEGESGELLIRSDANSLGYWGKPLVGREIVKTGDIGCYRIVNGQKFFYLNGRSKELINRGGEKFYPLELEAELRAAQIPGEFHVFPFDHESLGEEIAIAVLRPFDPNLLRGVQFARRPKLIYILKAFPLTSTGKIMRRALTDLCSVDSSGILWRHERG